MDSAGARNEDRNRDRYATAGIIVRKSLTGFGVQLVTIIETLSMGNIFLMLLLVAGFSLIGDKPASKLHCGVFFNGISRLLRLTPNGFIVPLIAAFVLFYFGIMADVTPPVGLAFAASAVSGGDPIKTGLTAFSYSLRTAILPFLFILILTYC